MSSFAGQDADGKPLNLMEAVDARARPRESSPSPNRGTLVPVSGYMYSCTLKNLQVPEGKY